VPLAILWNYDDKRHPKRERYGKISRGQEEITWRRHRAPPFAAPAPWSPTGKPVALSSMPVGRNPEQEPPAKAGDRVEGSLPGRLSRPYFGKSPRRSRSARCSGVNLSNRIYPRFSYGLAHPPRISSTHAALKPNPDALHSAVAPLCGWTSFTVWLEQAALANNRSGSAIELRRGRKSLNAGFSM